MDSARSWFQKLQHREKPAATKKKGAENVKDANKPPVDDAPSNVTKQKVAAAKQYIENHYKAQMKCLQDRKERLVRQIKYDLNLMVHYSIYLCL